MAAARWFTEEETTAVEVVGHDESEGGVVSVGGIS